MEPGKSSLLRALLLPWVSLETTFGALKVFVGLGRAGASLQGCWARQGCSTPLSLQPFLLLVPHPELCLSPGFLCSAPHPAPPLQQLSASLNLDPQTTGHLVCFSPTKSHCLLRNPCSGEVALLLEHAVAFAKGPSALLASAGAFGAAFVPDSSTAWVFFSCFSLSNHNAEVSHSEKCPYSLSGMGPGADP